MGNFWRIRHVVEVTGLSKSQVYRRMRDSSGTNPFPMQRHYVGGQQGVFWIEAEVRAWIQRETALQELAALIG